MAKKLAFIEEVERRYVVMNQTAAAIGAALNISERTITTWKGEQKQAGNDWDIKRANRLAAIASFPDELNELARELCRSIKEDLMEGKPIDQSRAILFRGILGKANKEKEFADAVKKEAAAEAPKKQEISTDTIKRVQRDILGIPG